VPTKALGFSLVCGSDQSLDPASVTLIGYDDEGTPTQLSAKETTFPARGSRLTFTTSTTKLFKHFRLQVLPADGADAVSLAAFELYGSAIADEDHPNFFVPSIVEATAPGLSNTELIGRVADGSRTTNYRADFAQPVSITYAFRTNFAINAYAVSASKNEPTRDPAQWTLEASKDGLDWIVIDSRTDQTFSQRYATQFYLVNRDNDSEPEHFSNYRFTVTATNGASQLQLGQLQLFALEKEDPTGIDSLTPFMGNEDPMPPLRGNEMVNSKWYDLSGRRVSGHRLSPGIYVVKQGSAKANGRKIAIK
jgi:hypothetical protein